jgi:hypothetical protein
MSSGVVMFRPPATGVLSGVRPIRNGYLAPIFDQTRWFQYSCHGIWVMFSTASTSTIVIDVE